MPESLMERLGAADPANNATFDQDTAEALLRQVLSSGPAAASATHEPAAGVASGSRVLSGRRFGSGPRSTGPPRRHFIRWATVGVAVVAAATAVLVVGTSGGGPTKALADWTPTPTTAATGQIPAAEASCQTAGLPSGTDSSAPSLVDIRGPYTMLVYADNSASGLCLAGVRANAPPPVGGLSYGTAAETDLTPVAADSVLPGENGAFVTLTENASPAISLQWIAGRAGTDVSAVTIALADGTDVQATVSNGWFAAWWPGAQSAQTAEITTSAGTTTQALAPEASPQFSAR